MLFSDFGAEHVDAFDIDPDMVRRARRSLGSFIEAGRLNLTVGNVMAIEALDDTFDAVFSFGVFHHVPDWRKGISEVVRVLKPGGYFFFEDVTKVDTERWVSRLIGDHPPDRFSGEEFLVATESQGLQVGDRVLFPFDGRGIMGVGRKGRSLEF